VRWTGLAALALCACGGGAAAPDAAPPDAAPPDAAPDAAPPITVDEPPDCGGDPLLAGGGDQTLVVSSLAILTLEEARDLDGDGTPDNKLSALGTLANDPIAQGIADGSLILLVEIFDRDADPDACVKLGVYDGACADAVCTVGDGVADAYAIDPGSVDGDGAPISRFRAAHTEVGAAVRLLTGPGFVRLSVPATDTIRLVLPVSATALEAEMTGAGADTALAAGRLHGVLQAFALDRQRGLSVPDIGLEPEHSLADAFFANIFGPILALEAGPRGCRKPDIDVDGDGLEAFCDSNPDDADNTVDVCIDGDGTMVLDGPGSECTEAVGPAGPRFVDGVSAAFAFTAEPALDI
jgi:hypothetical protein